MRNWFKGYRPSRELVVVDIPPANPIVRIGDCVIQVMGAATYVANASTGERGNFATAELSEVLAAFISLRLATNNPS